MTITVTTTTLYLDDSLESQRIEILAEEKGGIAVVRRVEQLPDSLRTIHPTGAMPLLLDKHLILYGSHLIDAYFEERYPAPPLLPATPIARSKVRFLADLVKSWYNLADLDLKLLHTKLDEFTSALDPDTDWFVGGLFSLVDIAMAPLLCNAVALTYPIAPGSTLDKYAKRLLHRPSVANSQASIELWPGHQPPAATQVYH